MTSRREGFPMVILEGMSYGVVPISTDVGEISSVVSEKERTGFLISSDENENQIVESFIAKITFITKNISVLQSYSQQSRLCVDEVFSEKKFQENYKQLFKN